jgi:hypothetical protein
MTTFAYNQFWKLVMSRGMSQKIFLAILSAAAKQVYGLCPGLLP